jgi:hypothetical protein
VATDGQVVEWLSITVPANATTPGIYIQGKKNVVIQNVRIQHHAEMKWPYGNGIYFTDSPNLTIYNVEVNLLGVDSGPLPDLHNYNIFGTDSSAPQISNVRTTGGSSGIELSSCEGGVVSNFVATNVRGPYPRGQCFQASQSDNVILQDFYCHNDNTSWTEDSISIWRSSNGIVRRGLVDGNDSPSGVGVMIEQDDMSKSGALVEDVDAVRMGDGCFSAYGGRNIRFVRTRCRENHCVGWAGRSAPMSGGLLYAAGDESGCNCSNITIEQSQYFAACNADKLVWEAHEGAWTKKDLIEVDFTLRSPVSVQFCWDAAVSEDIVV